MLANILIGFSVMVLCLILQVILLIYAIRYYLKHRFQANNKSIIPYLLVISGVMILLLIGNLGQIAVWALLFILLDEFTLFADAFYHSAVNFGSLGYGDIVMSEEHRLLGALEAINGVLMVGVSTAALMTPFKDALKITLQAKRDS
ncbi:MAG: two pore domain potassium channel family protein [gamma proteobacterium symbiont of Lucinoma myriamae]|nr:two pore domain potassium channel family protein [gamma proteobacterium symbiont of Lucinoma myriamae]MCU7819312.1 two pore domain potassium channel family protein [gamma proteobacterium symbiont of Lucinoma myriamae]MCU7831727.1 two pore domain potassium channel family protein [gamma proteobacterium symbiont of Lucinoma myriamae]